MQPNTGLKENPVSTRKLFPLNGGTHRNTKILEQFSVTKEMFQIVKCLKLMADIYSYMLSLMQGIQSK